jgi:hypothetical protein
MDICTDSNFEKYIKILMLFLIVVVLFMILFKTKKNNIKYDPSIIHPASLSI